MFRIDCKAMASLWLVSRDWTHRKTHKCKLSELGEHVRVHRNVRGQSDRDEGGGGRWLHSSSPNVSGNKGSAVGNATRSARNLRVEIHQARHPPPRPENNGKFWVVCE